MSKPVQLASRLERIARYTVWHPINTDPSDPDRWTVRVWLPLYDLLAILGGIIAYLVGSRLLNTLFEPWVVDAGALAFMFSGLITLVGVCVPNLWRIEAAGKIGMSFLLTTYAFLVLVFPISTTNNSFVTVILIMATWGVYPRLTRLFIRGIRTREVASG